MNSKTWHVFRIKGFFTTLLGFALSTSMWGCGTYLSSEQVQSLADDDDDVELTFSSATRLRFIDFEKTITEDTCSKAFTVQLEESDGTPVTNPNDTGIPVNLAVELQGGGPVSGVITYWRDSSCASDEIIDPAEDFVIPSGESNATFYLQHSTKEDIAALAEINSEETINTAQLDVSISSTNKLIWSDRDRSEINEVDLEDYTNRKTLLSGISNPQGIALDSSAQKIYFTSLGLGKIMRANTDGTNLEVVVGSNLGDPFDVEIDLTNQKIYWTDLNTDKIQRSNLDGSNVEDVITGLGNPFGLALDIENEHIYWTNGSTSDIRRANLDGTGITSLVSGSSPRGIVIDFQDSKLFWADFGDDDIHSSDLDGSNNTTILSGLNNPYGITIDTALDKIVWGNFGANNIQRMDKDGTNVETLVSTSLSNPEDFVIDQSTGKMYWVDFTDNQVERSNKDGSSRETLIDRGLHTPDDVEVDRVNEKIYFTDFQQDLIARINLNGSGREDIITGLNEPEGLSLDIDGGKVYYVDNDSIIARANLDGSSQEDLITGLTEPTGITLDLIADKFYWTDRLDSKVARANLDGSSQEDLISGGAPDGIALDIGAGKMIWSSWSGEIREANLDGTSDIQLVSGLNQPVELVLDLEESYIYWADLNASKIQRSNLDGSGVIDIITTDISGPLAVTISVAP